MANEATDDPVVRCGAAAPVPPFGPRVRPPVTSDLGGRATSEGEKDGGGCGKIRRTDSRYCALSLWGQSGLSCLVSLLAGAIAAAADLGLRPRGVETVAPVHL